jgi:tetratricopeptide (TPR) repeat protein
VTNLVLGTIIVAGAVYLIYPDRAADSSAEESTISTSTPAPPTLPPLPAPIEKAEEGAAVMARLDQAKLADWCRLAGLPDPPELGWVEKPVARSILLAYSKLADYRSGDTYGELGKIYESMDCHVVAEAYFDLAERAASQDFRWPYYRGCIYQLVGRNEEARAVFEKVESLNANYPVLFARLGQLNLEDGRLGDARARFTRYLELRPNDSLGYVGLARVALAESRDEDALEQLQIAVQKSAGDFQVNFYMAAALSRLGRKAEAQNWYDAAARLPQGKWFYIRDPLDQVLHQSTGSLQSLIAYFEQLSTSRDYVKLAEVGEQIIARRPQDTMMLANVAEVYRKLKRYEEAHELLDKALAIQPDMIKVYSVRASLYLAQGKNELALEHAEKALAGNPNLIESVTVKGRALLLMGRVAESEAPLRRVVEWAPENAGHAYVLGESLRLQGKTEEAIRVYEAIVQFSPGFQQARVRLEELRR